MRLKLFRALDELAHRAHRAHRAHLIPGRLLGWTCDRFDRWLGA